jgi:hypothetical protein
MNKIINFILLYISLFIIETISSYLILLFDFNDPLEFKGSFDVAILWNVWRVYFFGLPFIILYLFLFKYFRNIKLYKPLLFSLFNFSTFVSLCVLSKVIWRNVPLPPEGSLFWFACISIFSSPLILAKLPFFKKLMEGL